MTGLKWCAYCFDLARDIELPCDFVLIWESRVVAVYNCKHCGAYFIYPENKHQFYRTRKLVGSLLDYIQRILDTEGNKYD